MKLPQPTEHQMQQVVFKWAELISTKRPELKLLYAIPNQGKRSYAAANYLRSEGLRTGVPDICLPVASVQYHSLYIEMKRKGGKATPEQLRWHELLKSYGNCVLVCYSDSQAIQSIIDYLDKHFSW